MLHSSRWRGFAANAALIAFGTALGLVLAELSLRVAHLLTEKTEQRTDTSLGDNPPGSPGWPLSRGGKIVVEPKQSAHRIVVVGDSFTWGDGVEVEETYPFLLQSLLRERRSEADIEVINWSRPGWNTWRELRSIEPQLPVLEPDLLIIGYCINDAEPINRRQLLELRRALRTAQREPTQPLLVWLHEHTRLGALVYDFAENRRLRRAVTTYYQTLYDPGRSGWVRTREALKQFEKISRRMSIPMFMLIFPIFDSQLDHRYAYRDLHTLVAETAGHIGIDVVDLLPTYEGIDGRKLAVVPFSDAHPSPLAHRIAAEEIYRKIDVLAADLGFW